MPPGASQTVDVLKVGLLEGLRKGVIVALAMASAFAWPSTVLGDSPPTAPNVSESGRSLILISWDGVRRDTLRSLVDWQPIGESPRPCPHATFPEMMPVPCGEYLTCMPTLCRFQIIDSVTVGPKTLTRPQHAQMLSGYTDEITGIRTNAGTSRLPPGTSIYERIAELVGPDIALAHVAMPKYVSRGITRWARRRDMFTYYNRPAGRDGFSGRNTLKRVVPGLRKLAGSRFFFFMHFKTADKVAHIASDRSERYREALITLDRRLGELRQAMADLGIARTTDIYITTDHGFHGRRHVVDDFPENVRTWMASSAHDLDGSEPATVVDVVPTVISKLGGNPLLAEPPLAGQSRLR